MKRLVLVTLAALTLISGAWAAGCCDPASDCCAKACCKKAKSN